MRLRNRACRMSCLLPYRRRTGATKRAVLQPAGPAGARVWTLRFRVGLKKGEGDSHCSFFAYTPLAFLDVGLSSVAGLSYTLSCLGISDPILRPRRSMPRIFCRSLQTCLLSASFPCFLSGGVDLGDRGDYEEGCGRYPHGEGCSAYVVAEGRDGEDEAYQGEQCCDYC